MERETNRTTLYLTTAGLIAAIYVILTFLAQAFGLASGAIQFRISELLTILPMFTAAAIPGLTIGCILANMMTGCAMWDVVFGSVATLLGALGTYALRKTENPYLGCLPPIIANILIVPIVLRKVYGAPDAYWYLVVTVGIGEIVCCGILGILAFKMIQKRKLFK